MDGTRSTMNSIGAGVDLQPMSLPMSLAHRAKDSCSTSTNILWIPTTGTGYRYVKAQARKSAGEFFAYW